MKGFSWQQKIIYIDTACRWILAIVFLLAGVPKIFHPLTFATAIEAYGMLPDALILPVAIVLPFFEVVIAVALLLNLKQGLWGAVGLLSGFIVILGYALYLGLDIDCGCFGPEDVESHAFSNIRVAIARDVIFILFAIISLWIQRKKVEAVTVPPSR